MFELSYKLSEVSKKDEASVNYDLSTATATDFAYSDIFMGDIILKSQSANLSAEWDWVPILDFGQKLSNAYGALSGNKYALIEFTENSHQILFERDVNNILLKSTYSPGVIVVDYFEFGDGVIDFIENSFKELKDLHPVTKHNQALKTYEANLKSLKRLHKDSIKSSNSAK